MKTIVRTILLTGAILSFTGCVGYNSTLFSTKSNFGLDIDTTPPTAEISVARREGVIAPSFEEGKTPPVMASFKVQQNGLTTFFTGLGQTFAGGDSAVVMSSLYAKETPDPKPAGEPPLYDSKLNLEEEPEYKILFFKKMKLPNSNRIRPFVFGTDTSLGVKVAWSGLTAQVPDTAKVGFNRKEFALAPVNLKTVKPVGSATKSTYSAKMPSFLATVDSNVTVKSPEDSGLRSIQYFATGVAATQLAMEQQVRKAMLYSADPTIDAKANAFKSSKGKIDDNSTLLREFWKHPDGENINVSNQAEIREWMDRNGLINESSITYFLYSEDYSSERTQAAKDLNLPR